jgi:class 3 adenylate cyclase
MFMDAIYANSGDVNETAGDGLMVLFLDEDHRTNALQAVRAAIRIREEAEKLAETFSDLSERLAVNMGINSGTALVGAAKFNSYTGSRWTYTARGSTTNLAARLGAFATRGQVCISKTTAERVTGEAPFTFLGSHQLKNVSGQTEIYAL